MRLLNFIFRGNVVQHLNTSYQCWHNVHRAFEVILRAWPPLVVRKSLEAVRTETVVARTICQLEFFWCNRVVI